MTPNPITISPDTSVPDALRLMRDKSVRRLPVVYGKGKLVGIVSDKDLLHASPSPATSLSIWEITDLLSKLKVMKVMSKDVITVQDEAPVEEAALIMVDRRVGGLPVMQGEKLVGVITETDLFRLLLEMLGGRRSGLRVVVSTSGDKGTLTKISGAVTTTGGNIVGLGVSEFEDGDFPRWEIVFKVQGATKEQLVQALQPVVDEVLEVREM